MIASLSGTVLVVEGDAAVIETSGIGFRVLLPKRTVAQWRVGQRVQCHTHMIVGQSGGELTLVGFEEREELDTFRLLLKVPGIGPKAGLALVDSLSLDMIRSAVSSDQPGILTRVPGIGAKTAKRIIFDLRDKLGEPGIIAAGLGRDDMEMVEALTTLGYSVVEAQAAIQAAPGEGEFEDRLRAALGYFAR